MQCGRCHSPATHHTPRDSTPAGRHRHQHCTDSRFTRVCSIRTKCSTKTGSKQDDTHTHADSTRTHAHTQSSSRSTSIKHQQSDADRQTGRQTDRQTQTDTMTNRDGRAGNESVADHGGHGDEIERESATTSSPMDARRLQVLSSSHHHVITIS